MKILIGPLIGHVTARTAKVWIFWQQTSEGEKDPICSVFKNKADKVPFAKFDFKAASYETEYDNGRQGKASITDILLSEDLPLIFFKILFADEKDNNGEFYTIKLFPKEGAKVDKVSFALISCHHPYFNVKKDNRIVEKMWRYLYEKMQEHGCRFLIQAGDQLYCDSKYYNVWEKANRSANQAERVWYFQKSYLRSWQYRNLNLVLQSFPQYMIWDDHEICNSWGSKEEHYLDYDNYETFCAAKQVYARFQHCHNPSTPYNDTWHYHFAFGPVAFFVTDLRGHRDINRYASPVQRDPLMGAVQWKDFEKWLQSPAVQNSRILFIVTSVPVLHMSRSFGSLSRYKGDIADQWSTDHNKSERRRLLRSLFKWSGDKNRPVYILSGDVHVGTIAEMWRLENKESKIRQITSSPITNKPAWLLDFFLAWIQDRFSFNLDDSGDLAKTDIIKGVITERIRQRNFVIIEVSFSEQSRVKVYLYKECSKNPLVIDFP